MLYYKVVLQEWDALFEYTDYSQAFFSPQHLRRFSNNDTRIIVASYLIPAS
jgi:hypothetical protein